MDFQRRYWIFSLALSFLALLPMSGGRKIDYSVSYMSTKCNSNSDTPVTTAGIIQFTSAGDGYEPGECILTLRAYEGYKRISAIVTEVDMVKGRYGRCTGDRLDVYDGTITNILDNATSLTPNGICEKIIPYGEKTLGFTSKSQYMTIKMSSQQGHQGGRIGFRLVFTAFTPGSDCESGEWRCCDGRQGCLDKRLRSDGEPNCRDLSDEKKLPTCVTKVAAALIAVGVILFVAIVAGIVLFIWLRRRRMMRRKAGRLEAEGRRSADDLDSEKVSFHSVPLNDRLGSKHSFEDSDDVFDSQQGPPPYRDVPSGRAPPNRALFSRGDDDAMTDDREPHRKRESRPVSSTPQRSEVETPTRREAAVAQPRKKSFRGDEDEEEGKWEPYKRRDPTHRSHDASLVDDPTRRSHNASLVDDAPRSTPRRPASRHNNDSVADSPLTTLPNGAPDSAAPRTSARRRSKSHDSTEDRPPSQSSRSRESINNPSQKSRSRDSLSTGAPRQRSKSRDSLSTATPSQRSRSRDSLNTPSQRSRSRDSVNRSGRGSGRGSGHRGTPRGRTPPQKARRSLDFPVEESEKKKKRPTSRGPPEARGDGPRTPGKEGNKSSSHGRESQL